MSNEKKFEMKEWIGIFDNYISPKRVTVVRLEKINGRNRQSSSKRWADY